MAETSDTFWMLVARYRGAATVPLETVCKEHFGGMLLRVFLRKHADGEINLPVIRMTESQKAPRYVHVADLARYIDERHRVAEKEAS
jgi:hypothetical protein